MNSKVNYIRQLCGFCLKKKKKETKRHNKKGTQTGAC